MIGTRKRQPGPEAAPPACDCAARVAELEETVAALARAAVRQGAAPDAYQLHGQGAVDNRPDAAVIRSAARKVP